MNIETTYNIIFSLVGILALILFYIRFWQPYCLDAFRSNLFELRYKLIDLVHQEKISYKDTSYIYLRDLINSTIGNGHNYKFHRFLTISAFLSRNEQFRKFSHQQNILWEESLAPHDGELRERLQKIRFDYHMAIFQYFLSASLLFWWLIILAALIVVLTNAFSKFRTVISVASQYIDGISSYTKNGEGRVLSEGII